MNGVRGVIRSEHRGSRSWSSTLLVWALVLSLFASGAWAQVEWGSYKTPFAPDSPWNSRPVEPRFSDFVIPKSDYYPAVAEGVWSTGVFLASDTDPPVTVIGRAGSKGVWDPDGETYYPSVTIPHWPRDVVPAAAADGHADIIDPGARIVHSFFKLVQDSNGQWTAAQYAWTRLDGRGWGDPAHYMQGARAAGVATSGGLMRKHEIDDGQPYYRHALAMSLTYNALAASPTYVFPATSADRDAATTNTGRIPQGSLVMLPPTFDVLKINTPALRKVAETLKTYGAYVVDRNRGTPFVIYVENGSGFKLHRGGWNTVAAADLERIRQGLRQVVGVAGWVDGNGLSYTPTMNLNLLSMRGPWQRQSGTVSGAFDTWRQAVVFPAAATPTVMINSGGNNLHTVSWALPAVGQVCRLKAVTTGGGRLRVQLRDRTTGAILYDSKELNNGEVSDLVWPVANPRAVVTAISGVGMESTVRGELVRVAP